MRFSAALVVIVMLSVPFHLSAQRGGRRGGGGAGGAGGGVPASGTDQNMKDFDRAIAVQATSDQSAVFKSWVSSAESARKQAAATAREKENDAGDLSNQIASLRDSVNETQKSQEKFLGSFSAKQKSGLKEFTKNLGKADSAVVKALKTLDESSGRKNKEVVGPAEKLEQALTTFQTEQHKLGDEMGIQLASTMKTAAN